MAIVGHNAIKPVTRNVVFVAIVLVAIDEVPDLGQVAAGHEPLLYGDNHARAHRVDRLPAFGADVVVLRHLPD